MEKYQITKTIRFGLSLKKTGKKNSSHTELLNSVDSSERGIKQLIKRKSSINEQEMVYKVSDIIDLIKCYFNDWEVIQTRKDQIAFTKEYYKQLSVKANFNWSWDGFDRKTNSNIKQPQTSIVNLSSLKNSYAGMERHEYISKYWKNNLLEIRRRLHDFKIILEQYNIAVKESDKAHQKPQMVSFRKSFLYVISLLNETLIPINRGSICFPNLEKLTDEDRDERVRDFAIGDGYVYRNQLKDKIKEVKEYFEDNGGYVPFGRVTFNPFTAEQKPHKFNNDIENKINSLYIENFCKSLLNKSEKEIQDFFELKNIDKKKFFENKNENLITRVQAFKYKPIPISVRFMLADYLAKNKRMDKKGILSLFDQVGKMRSPAKDYADMQNKKDFDIQKYPLKIAFDYAWENLATYVNNPSAINFPKEKCEKFLEENFDLDVKSNSHFKMYADLLFIKQNLATLEHEENKPNNWEDILLKINTQLESLQFPDKHYKKKDLKEAIPIIQNWLNNYDKWKGLSKEEKKRKEKEDLYKKYSKAKNDLGLFRGEQKNSIKKYKELTETFKKLASLFGRQFAELRDKLQEESALNKIDYFGIVIEDTNKDRYVLIKKLDAENSTDLSDMLSDERHGSLKSYHVKSLTSKTLNKLIANKGKYPEFHNGSSIDSHNKDDSLEQIKNSLLNSTMAKSQNWAEFNLDFEQCNTYQELEIVIDSRAYILKEQYISVDKIKSLVESGNYFLLPFVNQDITSSSRISKNQFSKDWNLIFETGNDFRLHPEFKIVFRQPTPDYPEPGEKRYSRFQMIAHLLCEYIPKHGKYISKKEQLERFNDQKEQEKYVEEFNKQVNQNISQGDYYVIGIDRGLKQLATLCVLDNNGVIQKDFPIYTRTFNEKAKQWEHSFLENRSILDLSNLRVETTINNEKVLVDLSDIKVKDENQNYVLENKQKIKLKQLAYIRKLQFQMQSKEKKVLTFIEQYKTKEEIEKNIIELITPYKEGGRYEDLPIEKIMNMLNQFQEHCKNNDEQSKRELCELDAADDLKSGVVANMIGVVSFLLNDYENGKYKNKTFISLENLCRAFGFSKDGLTGATLESSFVNRSVDFKEQENLTLAGLGTYHFFEMQLLRKLFKIQQEQKIHHLVPAFRSTDNYETIRKLSKKNKDDVEYTTTEFGIVHFVDPKDTSHKCPNCGKAGKKNIKREENVITCKDCHFTTADPKKHLKKKGKNIELIADGDQNGAYHIALKTLENIQKQKGSDRSSTPNAKHVNNSQGSNSKKSGKNNRRSK